MRRTLILACGLVMVLVAIPAAESHLLWHHDAKNDAEYDDIVAVRMSTFRHDGIKILRANVTFAYHDEIDDCCNAVRVLFDSRGDASPDYMYVQFFDIGSGGAYYEALRRVGEGMVKARFSRSWCDPDITCAGFPVSFKLGLLHPTRHIRWYVKTFSGDRVPDRGWFEH